MKHESRRAEEFAIVAHTVWAVLCVVTAAVNLLGSIETYVFAQLPGYIGFIFTAAFWGCLGQVFFSLFGFLWHVFGAREHLRALRHINEQTPERMNCS